MAEKTVKKKPNVFLRVWRAIVRFFRDTRGEMKKVVWPSRKQVLNNFLVVIGFVVLAALIIFCLDAIFGWVLGQVVNLVSPA